MLHDEAGSNVVWSGVFDWGDWDGGEGRGRPRRHDRRAPLPPLQLDAARVRRARSSSTSAAPASGRSTATTRCPGIGAIWMAPGAAGAARQAPLRHAGHRRRLREQDLPAPAATSCSACSRGSSSRPIQWTEWRTDQHTANAHGNERWFHDVEVAVKADGTMLGFRRQGARRLRRLPPLRAARLHHLGAGDARLLPLAEHPRRLHAGDDEQVAGARRTAATRGCSTSG